MTAGRPKGSYQYGEAKVHRTHFMTPGAHGWILAHKNWVEVTSAYPDDPHQLRLKDLAVYGLSEMDLGRLEQQFGPLSVDNLPRALMDYVTDFDDHLAELETRAESAEDATEALETAISELKQDLMEKEAEIVRLKRYLEDTRNESDE